MLFLKEFKRIFLFSLIGSLIISSVVAVIVVLLGEFNTLTNRVLFTLFMVMLHSLISLAFIWDNERQKTFERLSFFSNVLFFLIVASFITSIFGVWEIISGELLGKIYQTYLLTGFASLHADILSKVLGNDKIIDGVVYSNYFFMLIVFIMLLPIIYIGNTYQGLPNFYYRVVGAVGIIDGTLSVLTIILYKLHLFKHPAKTDSLAANFTKLETGSIRKKGLSLWVWILIIYLALQMVVPLFYFGLKINQSGRTDSLNISRPNLPAPIQPTDYMREQPDKTFCKKYGTYEVKLWDLLEKYTIGPGETMRDIAVKKLNDETRAEDLIRINPELNQYEIDAELPFGKEILIPDDKYTAEGITSYFKTGGNITFNPTQPMFGVNAPNSGTGPFIIPENISDFVHSVKEGQCIDVVFGSRGLDAQKVVFDLSLQE